MAEGAIGVTFKVTRVLQASCMVAIIGMTSNFVAQIVADNTTAPSVLIATLSVVTIAILYCIITFVLYLDNLLPFLVAAIIDTLFLIALIVVSVVVGKPISFLNCNMAGLVHFDSGDSPIASAFGHSVPYSYWIFSSKSTCLEMKSIWGLSLALCILFTLSATTTVFLWKRAKQIRSTTKGEA